MTWASTIAGSVSTPNKSSRNGRKITGWIIHHNAARDGSGVLEMMRTGSKQVSANYQVLENGDVWGVVPREERSWSASNADWDGSSLTFEIANNSGAPGWTISDRAYDRVARTIAEDAHWAGIPINRTTVRGHSEGSALGDGGSYSTACPGGIDLDHLVQLAQGYYNGAQPATTQGDNDMRYLHNGDNRASIGEFSFTPYTDATHGGPAWNSQYQAAASTLFAGVEVGDLTFAVARQDALNRRASFLADIAAVANGLDPVALKASVKSAVQEALDDDGIDSNGIDVAVLVQQQAKAAADELAKRLGNG